MIELQKAILYATGRNLRLGSGSGLSIEDPVIVTENHHSLTVETERFAAKEIAVFYGWWQAKFSKISMLEDGDRIIEEFIIEYLDDDDEPKQGKLYFDITKGYKNVGKTLEQVKTADELKAIYGNTYFGNPDKKLEKFYGALTYARTLRPDERLDEPSLMKLLDVNNEHAKLLLEALKDCGANRRLR